MRSLRDFKVEFFTFSVMCLMIIGLSPVIVARGLIGASIVFITMVGFRLFLMLRQIPTTQ